MQPFCIAMIGAILGIVAGLYIKSIVFLFGIVLVCLFIILRITNKFKKIIIIALICFTSFFIYIMLLENKYEKIEENYDNAQITLHGIIVSNGKKNSYKTQYEVQVLNIYNHKTKEKKKEKFKLICNIKDNEDESKFRFGDEIIFESTFNFPSTERNEGNFNYSRYLKTKKIAGNVIVKKENVNLIGRNKGNPFYRIINNIRNNLIDKIYEILPTDESAICTALLLGEKNGISDEIEENFRQASLSHMLAISGAHISYILLGISTVFKFVGGNKRWSNIFVCLFLLFFMFLAGGSPSIVRACIMAILNLISEILFLKANTYNNLGISAVIIFVNNPYSIFDIGFQLSFGGTIGIVTFVDIFYDIKQKRKENSKEIEQQGKNTTKVSRKKYSKLIFEILIYVEQTIIMSLAANIIIIPIMLYNFSTTCLTFIISNLIATPIMGACLILGMSFIVCLVIKPFAYLISFLLTPLIKIFIIIAEFSSKIPFSKVLTPTPDIWQILLYYLIIIIYFFKDKIKIFYPNILKKYKQIICLLVILIILPYIFSIIPQNKLEINFIDVGQGDSMLITTPSNKKILIDGGGSEFGSFDVGEQTLLPYLLNKSILTLDYVLFTHFDTDHCQGLLTVLENIKVKNVIIGEQGEKSENFNIFLNIISKKNTNIIRVKADDRIKIDKKCELHILFPDNNLIKQNVLNNNSIVAKFIYEKYSILLTGDIEKIAEEKLISKYNNTDILNSTILKVAHHGSKSSSIQQFLNIVKPKIALIGVGEKNTFGHPNAGVIKRLENLRM